MVPMEKIDENIGPMEKIHAQAYVDSSWCKATIITDQPTTPGFSVGPCPVHLEYNRFCQACEEYAHMKEKQQYSMAVQHSIQDTYDTSCIIFIDGLPCCNIHDQHLQEWCGTCRKVVALRDKT